MSVLGVRRAGAASAGAAALLGATALSMTACDGEEEKNPPRPPALTSSSSSTTGGGDGGSGGGVGGGAGAGQGGQGGQGGGGGICGDGFVGLGEECDGANLLGQTCQSLGFDSGALACNADCTFNTMGCSGVEQCQDGSDNDGDGDVDCSDIDCAAVCADPCGSAPVLSDPAFVSGNTAGHAPLAEPPSCADPSSPGPTVVYQLTATTTGFLGAQLTAVADADLSVSVRSACASAATELACVNANSGLGAIDLLSIPIVQNDTVYVVVAGSDATQSGPFTLDVHSHQIVCGDGAQDPPEECDDANTTSGDGCSAQCMLEPTEVEPNDTAGTANAYSAPFFGAVNPLGDQDVVSVVVPSGPTSLMAETAGVTASACVNGLLDSVVEILNPAGTIVLDADDDGGSGLCSKAIAPALPAGTYFVRVKASPGGPTPTFPYRLDITLIPDVCGDMNTTPGEQCDDGNTNGGDGCSATCQLEVDETEPNNTAVQADPYSAPWLAAITPALDVDVVSIMVPGPSSMISASVGDGGTGACPANLLDSFVEILGTNGTTVLAADDDSGFGYCSFATAPGLAAGIYFVRVKAFQPNDTFLYSLTVTAQ